MHGVTKIIFRPAACLLRAGGIFPLHNPARLLSTDSPLVTTESRSPGITILRLHRPPVNGLNLELLTEFNIQLEKLENSKDCRAVILTSPYPVFCAGLDIMEFCKPNADRLVEFWRSVQTMWLKLYGSRMVTVAAINGAAPAGGCLMAMSCDLRIMVQNTVMGLNETQLGIVAPFWFRDTMVNTIGYRKAERALQLGQMFSSEEALSVGLVDRVVEASVLLDEAETEAKRLLKIPEAARQITKREMRLPTLDRLLATREADVQNFITFMQKESVQKMLHQYMESLKKKQ